MSKLKARFTSTSLATRLTSGVWYLSLIPFISFLFITACDKDCVESVPVNEPVYFQFEAKNYAWGLYHAGWFIDKQGKFDYYNLPVNWYEPDSLGFISKEELLSNLEQADSVIYQISVNDLQNQISLINEVDGNSFSEIEHVGADIGRLDLYCFKWIKEKSSYKRTLLATSGDFRQHNLDTEARELTAWLIAIGEKSGYFNWY